MQTSTAAGAAATPELEPRADGAPRAEAARWDLAVHLGPTLLASASVSPGLAAGLSLWPGGGAFGGVVAIGAALPSTFAVRPASLELQRYHLEVGPALRGALAERYEYGAAVLALVEHVRGEPSGLQTSAPVRDVRLGGVVAPWIAWQSGPLGLRLGLELRVLGGSRTYRAVPAVELATLPAVEGLGWLSVSYLLGEAR